MKKILALIVLTSIHLSILAQNEVFRIDSIPSEGILLDKGWKWHAGDNPDFAKPDFDDSKWERIDPTKDVMSLKQFAKTNTGWFRLKFRVDSTLYGQTYALSIRQVGSSKIYINGETVVQIGEFSTKSKKSNCFDPSGNSYKLTLGHCSTQLIAVKFEKPDIFLIKHLAYDNNCLLLQIVNIENAEILKNKNNRHSLEGFAFDYFKSGLFLLIAFLHLWLYLINTKNIPNLIFSILAFIFVIAFLLANYTYYPIKIFDRNIISAILSVLISTTPLLHSYALYRTYHFKIDIFFKILFLFCIISIISTFMFYEFGWVLGMIFFNFLASSLIIRTSWKAYKNGDLPAKAIANGELVYILSSTFVLVASERAFELLKTPILDDLIYNIGFFMSPLSVVYYFAFHFNQNSKNLQNKLIEVETLSKEKQEALQKQNAELQAALLQGQTIERKRVAADLHDSLGSTMSSLIYTVNAIDTNKLDEQEKNVYRHLKQMLDTAYNEIRLLSHNLLPEEFEKQGLAEALRYFIRKINQTKTIQFDLSIDPNLGRLSPKIEFELYSICLELINNILKHSKATEAKINLSKVTPPLGRSAVAVGGLNLTISDNGRGFFDNESDGKGIKNVKARIESLDGTWHIQNLPDGGMSSEIVVPI